MAETTFGYLADLQLGREFVLNAWAYINCETRALEFQWKDQVPPTDIAIQLYNLQITRVALNQHVEMFDRFCKKEIERIRHGA